MIQCIGADNVTKDPDRRVFCYKGSSRMKHCNKYVRRFRFSHTNLGVELCQKIKVFLEVGGEDRFNHQESEPLELHVVQVRQEVVIRQREEEVPGGGRMVVLQDGPVVIQNGLKRDGSGDCGYIAYSWKYGPKLNGYIQRGWRYLQVQRTCCATRYCCPPLSAASCWGSGLGSWTTPTTRTIRWTQQLRPVQ